MIRVKLLFAVIALMLLFLGLADSRTLLAQQAEEGETIDSDTCSGCHEKGKHDTVIEADLSHSIHEDLECQDCHSDKTTYPHEEREKKFTPGCDACRECHVEAAEQYQAHGRAVIGECEDMPQCKDCHGDHDILPSTVKQAKTHPTNLPKTCGHCHEDINLTRKYEILIDKPIELYNSSVHGQATKGGVYVAATCNDCHSTGNTAHRILAPGDRDSAINHFNIPYTCGKCHKGVENDFWEGIHGKLVARGETDAPVCTNCHGEHGILSPDDPRSPVSASKVAELTCSPCHESTVLNEKYGLRSGRLATFIDSYHGLKSKAGDTHVANCASCHGVHRILPSSDPTSTIHPDNLQHTCGECHPGISAEMANNPIHGVTGEGLQTAAANVIENIYIWAIILIIGGMVLHWTLDLGHSLAVLFRRKPKIRRMRWNEVWQHTLLMVSFIVLVISGFALRFSESWISTWFFGWEGGFQLRGIIHRVAAVVLIFTAIWHLLFVIFSHRGRHFFRDMFPKKEDFQHVWQKIMYNLGRRQERPQFGRFSYVEKAEYWALLWGTMVMVVTGLMLWFDEWTIQLIPKGALDIALVIHYWEAWLATLAILVWHMYSTVFNPHVYPMNPSWITGTMPEDMYKYEHPAYFEDAKKETQRMVEEDIEGLALDKVKDDSREKSADH